MQMVQEINVLTDKQWRLFHVTINNNVHNPHLMERFMIQYNLAGINKFGDQLAPNIICLPPLTRLARYNQC